MAVNLDEQLSNADWTKRRWDLPTVPAAFLGFLGPTFREQQAAWKRFKKRPAYDAMPEGLRRSIASLLD